MYPNPYYIISPPYIRTSAGVRVLYKLADLINKAGGSAYIYLRPHANHNSAASPMDVAPFLTQKTIDYHFKNELTPIVIYPETINASKFSPPIRIRYLLNYDDLLFKNSPLTDDDYLLSYSKNIEEKITVSCPKQTLFLPVSDPVFYCPPSEETIRHGACFYAGKFKYKFNGKTYPITDGLPEITRDLPTSQTPEEIRTLFKSCEFFYCYEDSALALEAMLCGCPTIFLPNEHFKKTLGSQEIAGLGYAWGTDQEQIKHAKKTVKELRSRYFKVLDEAREVVSDFIQQTQEIAQRKKYQKPFLSEIGIPTNTTTRLIDFLYLIKDSIADRGLYNFLKTIIKRIAFGRIFFTN
jgi:Zn-finger protein